MTAPTSVREMAVADYLAAKKAAEEAAAAAEQTRKAALIDQARLTVAPVLRDRTGKTVVDPKVLTAPHVDLAHSVVILQVPDKSLSFSVKGSTVRLARLVDERWESTAADVVTSLADVGAKVTG